MQNLIKKYNCALYCRFSKDDPNVVSSSVGNQISMLRSYVNDNIDWSIAGEYIDDGFTGTSFDRPGLNKLVQDIDAGRVNLVITKDLSRLGRNYVMAGEYIDFYFPRKGVRFIAINDNVDTLTDSNNDIVPIINWINEMYAKDISKKTRSVKTMKAREGKFMGSQPPYGYMRDANNKYVLVPDPNVRKHIDYIFKSYANGISIRYIADQLNKQSVLAPLAYKLHLKNKLSEIPERNRYWGAASITQMIKNQVYIGHMIQGKRRKISFKLKYREIVNPSDWIIVRNTHEPIIEKSVWDKVHERFASKARARKNKTAKIPTVSLFCGLVWCGDCGARLAINHRVSKNIYRCSTYANQGSNACTIHSVDESLLITYVLRKIRYYGRLARADSNALFEKIYNQSKSKVGLDDKVILHEKLNANNIKIHALFEEKLKGNIDENIYSLLMRDFSTAKSDIESQLAEINESINSVNDKVKAIESWIADIAQLADVKKLSKDILSVVKRITVCKSTTHLDKFKIKISFSF